MKDFSNCSLYTFVHVNKLSIQYENKYTIMVLGYNTKLLDINLVAIIVCNALNPGM